MTVKKRNGKIVDFDESRIYKAIENAMNDTLLGKNEEVIKNVTNNVSNLIYSKKDKVFSVEEIQDLVENFLMETERKDVAKSYILYRENQKNKKNKPNNFKLLDDDFISEYKHKPSPMLPLGEFVYYRTYSRFIKEEGRREHWWETVRRAVEYNCSLVDGTTKEEAQLLFDNMYNLKQFLSGRTMWVGGTEVAKKYPMSNFNCSFTTIQKTEDFVELFYLLMLGCGVGVRILKDDVNKIPKIRNNCEIVHQDYQGIPKWGREDLTSIRFRKQVAMITIGDSKTGWVDALKYYFTILTHHDYNHIDTVIFIYDNIRPNGEKLKTFGGTASGHNALKDVFIKINKIIQKSDSQNSFVKLKPINALDICNIIGEGVVVGGVRRTAEIALFDSDDEECIKAKTELYKQIEGEWITNKDLLHRQMSNNSIFYKEKPSREKLHWQIEQMRYSGEPAFVSHEAGSKRRPNFNGVNPCGEILLNSKGLCNLTTVNVMGFIKNGELDRENLFKAQRLSARAGYRMTCLELELPEWNNVQSEDRLIGCSLTGWQDMVNALNMTIEEENKLLSDLRENAHIASKGYSKALGLKEPLLTTTIKPEGTLSQLAGVSSGIHYSHSSFHIRRVRINSNDALVKVCEDLGYPVFPENGQEIETCKTKVVEFPMKAPIGRTKYDVSAIEQLENYIRFMDFYVDHNVSITVHVRENEWEKVEQWMWDNWDKVIAVSFLSLDESFYKLPPYESIEEEEYEKRQSLMKKFTPSLISKYEIEELETDLDTNSCESGVCPIR